MLNTFETVSNFVSKIIVADRLTRVGLRPTALLSQAKMKTNQVLASHEQKEAHHLTNR